MGFDLRQVSEKGDDRGAGQKQEEVSESGIGEKGGTGQIESEKYREIESKGQVDQAESEKQTEKVVRG